MGDYRGPCRFTSLFFELVKRRLLGEIVSTALRRLSRPHLDPANDLVFTVLGIKTVKLHIAGSPNNIRKYPRNLSPVDLKRINFSIF